MPKLATRLFAKTSPNDATQIAECPEPLDLSALERTPGFMIRILQIHIFDEFFEYFSSVGANPAEHSSLFAIRDNPSVTQSELAAALRIRLPNLIKILLKLEANDLITRKRSKTDKRVVELKLTPNGEKATAKIAKMETPSISRYFLHSARVTKSNFFGCSARWSMLPE